jgi:hypothetical protein
MLRKFTQDVGGTPENPRFKAGEIRDFLLNTWRQLALSVYPKAKDAAAALDKFSEPVNVN